MSHAPIGFLDRSTEFRSFKVLLDTVTWCHVQRGTTGTVADVNNIQIMFVSVIGHGHGLSSVKLII